MIPYSHDLPDAIIGIQRFERVVSILMVQLHFWVFVGNSFIHHSLDQTRLAVVPHSNYRASSSPGRRTPSKPHQSL